jgi:hypothetical protein
LRRRLSSCQLICAAPAALHNPADGGRLPEAGATPAYPEAIEASLRLGAAALEMVGASPDNVEDLLRGVRNRDYELVREDDPSAGPPAGRS